MQLDKKEAIQKMLKDGIEDPELRKVPVEAIYLVKSGSVFLFCQNKGSGFFEDFALEFSSPKVLKDLCQELKDILGDELE